MGKSVNIDFSLCRPGGCQPDSGICSAIRACKKRLLEQEEPFDPPMLLSKQMCVGCGDCVRQCPLRAITVSSGM